MTKKGTEGRMPEKNIGAGESELDKLGKKVKKAFSGDSDSDQSKPSVADDRPSEKGGVRKDEKGLRSDIDA
jgi:hypothetical protein